MEFRKDINGLRALAVILVLLFHFGTPGFDAGFIGVDIFFVISGFLMTAIILRGLEGRSFSIIGFYRARLVRLYPALLALTAATLLFGLAFIEPATLHTMARHGLSSLLFVSNMVFWNGAGYFGAAPETMWFLHTWSLSVEWQFYLIYPLVLALAFLVLRRRAHLFALLLAGFALSLGLSVMAGFFPNERLVSAGFYMLPTRAWEMLAGGLVVLSPWRPGPDKPRLRGVLEIGGLFMIAASLPLFSHATPWPSWQALLPVVGTMLVLAADAPRSLLAAAPLQWVGTASYSIYLWHWPIVAALAYFGTGGTWVAAAAISGSLLAGWASYTLVEQPCRRFLKPSAVSPVRPAAMPRMAALAASTLAVLGICGLVVAGDGLPQRSHAMAAVYAASLDAASDYGFPLGQCGGTTTFGTRLRPCELGTPSAGDDVLVMGDSFAEIWFPRVREVEPRLASNAVVFLTKGGCPPVGGLERDMPGFGCGLFHEKAMDEARDGRFGTVILAGMWASYFEKARANATVCDGKGACHPAGTEAGLAAAMANLAAEIDELRGLGKTVVVLTTSPYPGFDVPAELRKQAFAGRTPPADWNFDFSAMIARAQPVDEALRRLATHGTQVLDLAALLCRDMICPAARNMIPLYTDTDHLRSSYTAQAGSFLDPFLGLAGAGRDERVAGLRR